MKNSHIPVLVVLAVSLVCSFKFQVYSSSLLVVVFMMFYCIKDVLGMINMAKVTHLITIQQRKLSTH